MMVDGGWMGWGGGMWLGPIIFIAVTVLVIWLIVMAVRAFDGGGGGRVESGPPAGGSGNRALDILDERFARGEIDREEYEERRRILTRS